MRAALRDLLIDLVGSGRSIGHVWGQAVSFVVGVAAGLVVNMLWVRRWRLRSALERVRRPRFDVLDFDPTGVGLFPINRWSPARRLRRDRLQLTIVQDRPAQHWCDLDEWNGLAERFRQAGKAGDLGYLVDFEVDHHESPLGEVFRYSVAHCEYWEHLATVACLGQNSAARSRIWEALWRGRAGELARSAPPSSIKINVAILSPDNRVLAVQRSGAVDHKKGMWTVGPNETMVLNPRPTPGVQHEDLFGLAERCLREELHLEPADYGQVNISWFGYDVNTAQVKVFAQVRTHLPRREVQCRQAGSHGVFEAQAMAWLPLDRATVRDVIENWERGDVHGRVWSASAALALQELWRFRSLLQLTELA